MQKKNWKKLSSCVWAMFMFTANEHYTVTRVFCQTHLFILAAQYTFVITSPGLPCSHTHTNTHINDKHSFALHCKDEFTACISLYDFHQFLLILILVLLLLRSLFHPSISSSNSSDRIFDSFDTKM